MNSSVLSHSEDLIWEGKIENLIVFSLSAGYFFFHQFYTTECDRMLYMKKSIAQNGGHPHSEWGEKGGEGEKGRKMLK